MTIAIIIGVILVAVFAWLFLVMAKRTVRLFVRLAVLGVVVLAALAGAVAWWWYAPSGAPAEQNVNRPGATRRANNR